MSKLLLICTAFLFVFGCKKADPIYSFDQENIAYEGLTYKQDSFLASLPARNFKPSEILLENGETVEQFLKRTDPTALQNWGKKINNAAQNNKVLINLTDDHKMKFVANLLTEGERLTTTLNWNFKEEPDIISGTPPLMIH